MIKESRNIAAAVAALTLSVAAFAHNDSAMAAEHVEAANCVAGASKSPATGKASATDNASAAGCLAGVASTSSATGNGSATSCAGVASTSSAAGNGSAANNTAAAKDLTTGQDLYKEFQNPPKSARPRVWWHWMNGNITKDGIKKDLLWMQKTGIVGFHNFDAGLETPQIVDKRLIYMTPEWKEAFKYAINLADSLDMEMTIASSPGWSETGGPWVKDEDAMKKLVWRQIEVKGGQPVNLKLPEGFDITGPFMDFTGSFDGISQVFLRKKFYRDIAVVGVRLCDKDINLKELYPTITSSGCDAASEEMLERITGDSVGDYLDVKADKNGRCWIQYEFAEPQTIKAVVVSELRKDTNPYVHTKELQYSDDGVNFKSINLSYQATAQRTYAIPATTAKYFRLSLKDNKGKKDCEFGIAQFALSTVTRIQLAGDKAGNSFYRLLWMEEAARLEDVVDLTPYVKDGTLTWNAPEGNWRIFRFGYSLTGKTNHPASPEATGLEVDKLDPKAITEYFHNYLQTYADASGGKLGKGGIEYLLTDSYEAGAQTWTRNMFEEFKARKGYDLLRWMPALTGMVLNSTEETERFLFDWRRTIGDMISEYHYDLQNEILKPYGMKRYTESHENYRANLTDGMDCKRYAEIPMSAFWMDYKNGNIFNPRFEADVRESASVAHIYGQNIAAAESFTSDGYRDGAWVFSPAVLKPTADAAMAAGLNRFVIHTSPHQPVDDKVPGLGLGKYGQWFDRHQTWADQAKAWTDYLSRSCYMLQQGRFVADVAYYYGEDNNATGIMLKKVPALPYGYNYDYFSPSVIRDLAKAENGLLTVPSGMKYKVLMLDANVKHISIDILRKIKEFADAGVVICGAKPQKLAGNTGTEEEFKALVNDIWNSGRKNVTAGVPAEKVLSAMNLKPDFSIISGNNKDLKFVHRSISDGEIYWVTNLSKDTKDITASFRTTGKKPVIWNADDASTEPVSYEMVDGRTNVRMNLTQHRSVFVIFTEDTDVAKVELPKTGEETMVEINTPWSVKFQQGRGVPETATFNQLASLTESSEPGIKYFSGAVTYSNIFKLKKKEIRSKDSVILDLGDVKDLAEVTVNGKNLGVFWNAPFKVDITKAVRNGENTIEVKVINMWHNRLVGDVQPGVTKKITYTQMEFFKPEEPLLPAGLLGPVKVIGITVNK